MNENFERKIQMNEHDRSLLAMLDDSGLPLSTLAIGVADKLPSLLVNGLGAAINVSLSLLAYETAMSPVFSELFSDDVTRILVYIAQNRLFEPDTDDISSEYLARDWGPDGDPVEWVADPENASERLVMSVNRLRRSIVAFHSWAGTPMSASLSVYDLVAPWWEQFHDCIEEPVGPGCSTGLDRVAEPMSLWGGFSGLWCVAVGIDSGLAELHFFRRSKNVSAPPRFLSGWDSLLNVEFKIGVWDEDDRGESPFVEWVGPDGRGYVAEGFHADPSWIVRAGLPGWLIDPEVDDFVALVGEMESCYVNR